MYKCIVEDIHDEMFSYLKNKGYYTICSCVIKPNGDVENFVKIACLKSEEELLKTILNGLDLKYKDGWEYKNEFK